MPSVTESLTRDWLAEHLDGRVLAQWQSALPFLRPEHRVLVPDQMRHSFTTEGSLAATLVRRITDDDWRFTALVLAVDEFAGGDIAYRIDAPDGVFTFGVRSVFRPDSASRAGRLRENTFDFYGCVFAGEVSPEVLSAEHDEQVAASWKGRTTANALGWSFANRGSRSFDATIDALAHGRAAPLDEVLANGGYLVRNAGFYGNGRHGSVPWLTLAGEGALAHPYHLDLLTLFMLKLASFDFVEGAARQRNARAGRLGAEFRRRVGVGNSSGIGTVATLVRWPTTLAALTLGRELAVARGRSLLRTEPTAVTVDRLATLMGRYAAEAVSGPGADRSEIAPVLDRISHDVRRGDLGEIDVILDRGCPAPIAAVLVSALADLDPDAGRDAMPIVAQLIRTTVEPDAHATVGDVLRTVETRYDWVRELEQEADLDRTHFWYRSSENGENRRGERALDPGVERETFVDVATAIRELQALLLPSDPRMSVAEFLLAQPHMTGVVGRVLLTGRLPYTEIRANLVSRDFAPADVIRYFLTGLGIRRAQPASRLWVGGVFMADLPSTTPLEPGLVPGLVGKPRPTTIRPAKAVSDKVRVGYPELRRIVPDALRSVGVPATITAEAAELTTWTEAATGTGIESLLDLHGGGCELTAVEVSQGTIALGGQSLVLLGVRIAEYAALASADPTTLRLTGARHPGVLPYLSAFLARRGLCSALSVVGGDGRDRAVVWGSPDHVGGGVFVDRAFLESVRRDPRVRADAVLSVSRDPMPETAADVEDVTSAVDRCREQGILVDPDKYRALLAASASLRVPNSERSRSQAG